MGEGKPSEAPRTFRTLRNSLLSLELAGPPVSPGLAFVPSVSARPPDRFSIPRSFFLAGSQDIPTVVSSPPLACPRSAGPPPQSCTPLVFPSSRTQPLGPLRWAAGRLGWNPDRESSRLGGGRSSPPLQKGLRVPSAGPRHEGLCCEWGSGISRLLVLRASGPQVVAGAFAASAARRSPCGPRGAPRVAGGLENLPGWRLCERRAFPEDAERLAGAPRVAAPVPGALARSGKKRAVFAFANKREPELFHTGEAGRAAPAFPPPRRSRQPRGVPVRLCRLPLAPGGRWDRAAPSGGERAAGRPCARGCARGLSLQNPSLQLQSCRTWEQQVVEDAASSTPTCGAPSLGGCCAGTSVWFRGRLFAWVVSFVYTLEDT